STGVVSCHCQVVPGAGLQIPWGATDEGPGGTDGAVGTRETDGAEGAGETDGVIGTRETDGTRETEGAGGTDGAGETDGAGGAAVRPCLPNASQAMAATAPTKPSAARNRAVHLRRTSLPCLPSFHHPSPAPSGAGMSGGGCCRPGTGQGEADARRAREPQVGDRVHHAAHLEHAGNRRAE